MRTLKVTAALFILSLTCLASHRRSHAQTGQSGVFDFYLLVLSWSPEFCYSRPAAAECSEHKGFVVHGLWPQNNDGSYPSNCRTDQPGPSNPLSMSDIMPAEIVRHEWQQHGTCSGLSGDAYFALIRKAYESVRIPQLFKAPAASFATTSGQLKHAFEGSNPQLNDSEMAVQLRTRYLNAVEICIAKGSNPQAIPCSGLRDARSGTFLVPPVK